MVTNPSSSITSPRLKQSIPEFVHCYDEGNEGRVTHIATQKFIDDMREELRLGYRFVPFIGAGFSVSAGIPITEQLRDYLRRCICVALGAEIDIKEGPRQLWNPRTDQWPPFIDRKRPEPTRWQDLVRAKFEREERKTNGNPQIFQEAFGAMAEWRTSLLFLSRLILDSPRTKNGDEPGLSLGLPQQEVIDACFREVMRHKKPSLNHLMLGSLSGPLRLDLILSTNFDDLLEQAFESKRISLQVFEVHLGGRLPDYSAVSRVRALIKLHGSLHSVRADYSLDAPPSPEDKNTFVEYLAGEKTRSSSRNPALCSTGHLLVLGVGATERRSLEFIRYAWEKLDDFKVFWVCYSDHQEQAVLNFCRKHLPQECNGTRAFHILRHTEIGLLLLHMYQDIRKTLPPSGAIFPSVTRIPLPPLPRNSPSVEIPDEGVIPPFEESKPYRSFLDGLTRKLDERQNAEYKLLVATGPSDAYGVTSACAEIFRAKERDNFCIWIDMNDISSADNLFEVIQEASYFKLGQDDWTPLYATKDDRPREVEINRIGHSGNKPWIIFLNAREKPGANRSVSTSPNGWMDAVDEASNEGLDQSNSSRSFLLLLDELCGQKDGRISVVLICRDPRSHLIQELRRSDAAFSEFTIGDGNKHSLRQVTAIVDGAIAWTEKGDRHESKSRQRFLHALVLMQRPRLLASVWDDSFNPEQGSTIFDSKKRVWLEDLHRVGLLRWKDGGFIWLRADCREEIRNRLRKEAVAGSEHQIHKRLAAWYSKVFDATGVAPAIFEAVDHYCFAAESILRLRSNESKKLISARLYVGAARRLLKDHSFLIQTHGHPRNSIRRLDFIRDFWIHSSRHPDKMKPVDLIDEQASPTEAAELKKSIIKLQCVSVEIARAIFREIGEDGEAYQRQRELQQRIIHDQPL